MKKINVLIADDSVVYRSQIRSAFIDLAGTEVIGAVANGKLAIERISQGNIDLLILDLEMPEMDGLQTLRELNARGFKCKVLVFSSASKRGSEVTMEALCLGASDFIAKPGADNGGGLDQSSNPRLKIKALIEPKVHALFPELKNSTVPLSEKSANEKYPQVLWDILNPQIVLIGSSTGGPKVLEKIFSELAPPLNCPIVIAQHMPPIFTATLADRLSKLSGIPVSEAKHQTTLENGHAYVAPGDFHLRLEGTTERAIIMLDQGPQINSVRPAVDPLFSSAAAIYKSRCLAFVLTGMGADGKDGAEVIKQAGGAVVIQSKSSCVVFGMPGAVFATGAYDRIADPSEIIQILRDKVAPTLPSSNRKSLTGTN